MSFDPKQQWKSGTLDLQSRDKVRINRRNLQVPVIEPPKPTLTGWVQLPHERVAAVRRRGARRGWCWACRVR